MPAAQEGSRIVRSFIVRHWKTILFNRRLTFQQIVWMAPSAAKSLFSD
jgi:hypothetical protein